MESVTQTWLARQCELIPGAAAGLVLLGAAGEEAGAPAANWPEGTIPPELIRVATTARARGRVVVEGSAQDGAGRRTVAVPFRGAPDQAGAVAVAIDAKAGTTSRSVVDSLRSGVAWLDLLGRQSASGPASALVLELLGLCLGQERFRDAATVLATELATRLGFERVAVGFLRRRQMHVEALSHSAKFDERTALIQDLAAAMEEAGDQDVAIVHPDPAEGPPRLTLAHEQLRARHRSGAVCTIPFACHGRIAGAVSFERAAGAALEAPDVQRCTEVVSLLGPLLAVLRAADARWLERSREWLRAQLARLTGPGHVQAKAVAGGLAVLLLLTLGVRGDYRVAADATLEGRVQRAIVAGIEGYIAEANARAGDVVRENQVLGRLDERDLVLERRKWVARREQFRKEHREALAAHDRSQANILSAKVAQANAQLELLNEQLARTRLVAPFDGVVVKGDLSQSLGSPVEKGQVLFEVAPLDGYRIILKVDERDIADVAPGKAGRLVLSALPGETLPLTVERITPITTADDGRNHFRVEARLERPVEGLRPGMEGVAKIEVARRPLLWIWTHDMLDWLRLWAWSWWP